MSDLFGEQRIVLSGNGYAAAPGSGPAGETCKTCNHSHLQGGVSGRYWKCALVTPTASKSTDIRITAPACSKWATGCKKCGGTMKPSKAIWQTYTTGSPELLGKPGITHWPGGPGKLVDCLKCEKCGWSVT